jgi:predicted nucleic acid-binding protein
MAFVLRLEGRKLGTAARAAFDAAEAGTATIFVPAMLCAEVLYLVEKRRISLTLTDVGAYLKRFPGCVEYPMSLAVVQAAAEINDVRELHDRLIAGTARVLQRPLITNDPTLQASVWITTLW